MAFAWQAANAFLLELRGPGAMDRYGEVVGQGSVIWSGALESQLLRTRHTEITSAGNTPVETDVLIVRKPPKLVAEAYPGDQGRGMTVLVRDERTATPVTTEFRLTATEHRGIGEAESVRFELDDERV